jgi:spermidine synthase
MDIKGTCISSTIDEHGPIYVYQNRTCRILSFDGKIYQSSMKLNDINGLHLGYTQAMMAALLFIPRVNTATIMGLGAGSMVKKLLSSFSELNIHAIEYREAVAKVSKEYFYLPDTERLFIHIDDAANYIKKTKIKSDIIFSDLYNSKGMEPKQVESSYLRDCKNALNKQGILVLNIWNSVMNSSAELNELLQLEFENQVLSFKVESGNIIILAFKGAMPLINKAELMTKSEWLQDKMNIPMKCYAKLIEEAQNL